MKLTYFDHNATTQPATEVVEAMARSLREHWGNPSSAHPLGLPPEGALVVAREQVAALIGAQPAELVFTSGGTESLNQAFRGLLESVPDKRHVVISAVEHSAVMEVAKLLQRGGLQVDLLPVDGEGRVRLELLDGLLRPDTALVSVMLANNETGVLQPVAEVARIARARGVRVHTDAVQALGRMPVSVETLGVDLLSGSAHKFHGPKGAGFLFVRRGLRLRPFVVGGGQERGRRGGTENVPGLVGMGCAAEAALKRMPEMAGVRQLRDLLERDLEGAFPELRIQGQGAERLPNTSLISLRGLDGEALLLRLGERGFCVSTGSACTTGRTEPSHVLQAMGVPLEWSLGTLRVSLGRENTAAEVEAFRAALVEVVAELRSRL